ncbi:TRAP transporter small permease [Billgrantia desiderata]|uniref:TRAP transporter small permease protein n=1 Tax=Billgrantia desiderata TaxID=52021 RepID=A0AAW4YUQ1_9GAMM|nr:TRAP transporter small permease [Halomonas desiderata]MCE8010646.1 TRAP transporter small permease [Halomonas desiderata]MCE8029086.1 TRAP transporter small permease [Halomonas desiderata]MCE8041989.1 TRAP transporter small permease [Halomonas desiderata]MCE8046866.1 TRAP transporter small permease [Halomonas desiderata]MCE8051855.1 TRAP transporter small permease [Halomonas desiderata]
MGTLNRISRILERLLEIITVVLMVSLTLVVLYAVVTRYAWRTPSWYDEVAAIMLVWLTYYAGALAALKRGHIGVDGVLAAMPIKLRMPVAYLSEALVIGFFAVLCWAGLVVIEVMQGMALITLRWVPLSFTQSVIPIGAGLFIIAQLLSMPAHLAKVRSGRTQEEEEIRHAIAEAERDNARAGFTADALTKRELP